MGNRRLVRGPAPVSAFTTTSNTGLSNPGLLTVHNGDLQVGTDNTTVSNLDIRGQLLVRANNVTVNNCKISEQGSSPTDAGVIIVQFGTNSDALSNLYSGFAMNDCEITRPAGGTGGADYGLQLYCNNTTLRRVRIHNVTSGIQFLNSGLDMQDSMIDTLVNISGSDHNDCIIASGGTSDVLIQHNTFLNPEDQTAIFACYPEFSANFDWTINNNYVAGGGFCWYVSYTKGSESPNHDYTITNNRVGRDYFTNGGANGPFDGGSNGASFFDGANNVWSGNVYDDNGATINAI